MDSSFISTSSDVPDDPSYLDARRALKTLQCYAAKHLCGVAAMDSLMKLEICLTNAKLEGTYTVETDLPE